MLAGGRECSHKKTPDDLNIPDSATCNQFYFQLYFVHAWFMTREHQCLLTNVICSGRCCSFNQLNIRIIILGNFFSFSSHSRCEIRQASGKNSQIFQEFSGTGFESRARMSTYLCFVFSVFSISKLPEITLAGEANSYKKHNSPYACHVSRTVRETLTVEYGDKKITSTLEYEKRSLVQTP